VGDQSKGQKRKKERKTRKEESEEGAKKLSKCLLGTCDWESFKEPISGTGQSRIRTFC